MNTDLTSKLKENYGVYIGGPMGVFGSGIESWRKALHRYGELAAAIERLGPFASLVPHEQFISRFPSTEEVTEYVLGDNQHTPHQIYRSDMDLLRESTFAISFLDVPSHGVGAELALQCKMGITPFVVIGESYYSKFIEGMFIERFGGIAADLLAIRPGRLPSGMLDVCEISKAFVNRAEMLRPELLVEL